MALMFEMSNDKIDDADVAVGGEVSGDDDANGHGDYGADYSSDVDDRPSATCKLLPASKGRRQWRQPKELLPFPVLARLA